MVKKFAITVTVMPGQNWNPNDDEMLLTTLKFGGLHGRACREPRR